MGWSTRLVYYDGVYYGDWTVFSDLHDVQELGGAVMPKESKTRASNPFPNMPID